MYDYVLYFTSRPDFGDDICTVLPKCIHVFTEGRGGIVAGIDSRDG